MAIASAGGLSSYPNITWTPITTGLAVFEVLSSPVGGGRVLEIALNMVTNSSSILVPVLLGVPDRPGTSTANTRSAFVRDDPGDPASLASVAKEWIYPPQTPSNLYRRQALLGNACFYSVWTFPAGITISPSRSLAAWITGTPTSTNLNAGLGWNIVIDD